MFYGKCDLYYLNYDQVSLYYSIFLLSDIDSDAI